jgi:hypothetical protein
MKVKYRAIDQAYCNSEYRNFYIQILLPDEYSCVKEYAYSTACEITFQTDKRSEEERPNNKWYAMRFVSNTDNVEHLEYFTKVAKYVKENTTHDRQPSEVMALLGEEYFYHDWRYYPIAAKGQKSYRLMRDAEQYHVLFALNDILAEKKLEKIRKANSGLSNLSLEFDHVIV